MDKSYNIEYGVKSYQVKMIILNYTKVCIKGLKVLTAHRKRHWYGQQVCDAIKHTKTSD